MSISDAKTNAMTAAGLNLIAQAMSIYDNDLVLITANHRFAEMFSLPGRFVQPGARFGDTLRYLANRGEYGPIPDVDAYIAGRIAQAKAFEPHYMERQRADGTWISVEGSPLPKGGWVAVYTDITDIVQQQALLRARSQELSGQLMAHTDELAASNRKLAATNKALEEAKRQLIESEARTRLTTEMIPAHIAHVGLDQRYTYSNQRLSGLLPGRPSNIVGLSLREALGDYVYGRVRPHMEEALSGTASTFEFTDRSSARRMRVAFTPDLQDGAVQGVYILSTDITAETQARTALQQTRKRELAAQVTSGMAHDFSNLLTIILGMQSQLAQTDLPQEARALVEATLQAARRGGNLLDRIAGLVGTRAWRPVATNLDTFVADLRTLAKPALGSDLRLTLQNRYCWIPANCRTPF